MDCHSAILHKLTNSRLEKHTIFFSTLDIHKAYDSVNISILLNQLEELQWTFNSKAWITQFLTHRTAQVKWRGVLSTIFPVSRGVPQGAVISALMFIIYTMNSHLLLFPHSDLFIYADDVFIITSHQSATKATTHHQSAITALEKWYHSLDLNFSISKSSTINVSNTNNRSLQPNFLLNNESIPWKSNIKILGITYNQSLNWSNHLSILAKKCTSFLNFLKILRNTYHGASTTELLNSIKTHFFPIIDYCGPIFINSSIKLWQLITTPYRTALRLASGLPQSTPIPILLAECNMPSIADRMQMTTLRYFAKSKARPYSIDRKSPFLNTPSTIRKPRIESTDPSRSLHNLWTKLFSLPIDILKVHYHQPHWIPDSKIFIHLRSLPFQQSNLSSLEISSLFNIYLDSLPPTTIIIATDGSLSSGKAGFGYTCPTKNIHNSFSLPSHSSIITAEGLAIYDALKTICNSYHNFVIFSDSFSNLSAIKHVTSSSSSLTLHLTKLLSRLTSSISSLKLIWTPSHHGIKLNDTADKLANIGRTSINNYCTFLTFEDTTKKISKTIIATQIQNWSISNYATTYPHIHPTHSWLRNSATSRYFEVLISRLRTNTAPLAHYLHRIKQIDSPLCQICFMPETAIHYLNECIAYTDLRTKLNRQISLPADSTIYNYLMIQIQTSNNSVKFIESFIRDSRRFDFLL